jgi:hypothetical protein
MAVLVTVPWSTFYGNICNGLYFTHASRCILCLGCRSVLQRKGGVCRAMHLSTEMKVAVDRCRLGRSDGTGYDARKVRCSVSHHTQQSYLCFYLLIFTFYVIITKHTQWTYRHQFVALLWTSDYLYDTWLNFCVASETVGMSVVKFVTLNRGFMI